VVHGVTSDEIARLVAAVDYSEALTITATEAEVRQACRTAARWRLRSVAAFPQFVGVVAGELAGSGVLAMVAVGFPCGGHTTRVKCVEADEGLRAGATDLDMVMNIAAFKARDYKRAAADIAEVRAVARPSNVPFKVIIEIGALTDEEIVDAARLVADTGADFVKTCTGFGPGRATVHAVAMIHEAVGRRIRVKASGGVASIEDGVCFMRAGASVVAMRGGLVSQLESIGYKASSGPSAKETT
jgi:deoxyribose-phosphate aldolase